MRAVRHGTESPAEFPQPRQVERVRGPTGEAHRQGGDAVGEGDAHGLGGVKHGVHGAKCRAKRLCDPRNLLNPGVLINENHLVHIADLKVNSTVDAEVDRCVECGYCEPVCPSRDLTTTPRQRIVIRRAMAKAQSAGDLQMLKDLTDRYEYDGVQTCAADGMCAVSCPVNIDTGALVTRLRAERQNSATAKLAVGAARHWGFITTVLSAVLTITKRMPASLVERVNLLLRKLAGTEVVPMWNQSVPRGGTQRKSILNPRAEVLYFPSCINSLFGTTDDSMGVMEAFLKICERVGIEVAIPENIAKLCCGTPWKSKGLMDGYQEIATRTKQELLRGAKSQGIPIVCDATSCTDGLSDLITSSKLEMEILDALEFIADRALSKLTITHKVPSIALHPTCSGVQLGLNLKMLEIAQIVANEVFIPENWACCGFAGDRGLLHPELTASATAAEVREVESRAFTKYASSNRPCEIGMSQATGQTYQHLLVLLEEVSRP